MFKDFLKKVKTSFCNVFKRFTHSQFSFLSYSALAGACEYIIWIGERKGNGTVSINATNTMKGGGSSAKIKSSKSLGDQE